MTRYHSFVVTFLIASVLSIPACSAEVSLKSEKQKVSYFLGQKIGQDLKAQGFDLDLEAFSLSVGDVLTDRESRLSEEDLLQAFQTMQKQMMEKQAMTGQKNKEVGDKFLIGNRKESGVKVTASGLQYKVLTAGKGKSPKKEDKVRVHYKGTLIDGTEFDSSYKRNQPAEFPLNDVLPGWTEGLQLMKEGAKWEFYIPSDLAYGERGRPSIPPNSVLIFEVELLEIL